jgi:two-component system, NarL family, sensor kinase
MWILARCSRNRPSRNQLESLLVERTIALEKLTQRLLKLQDEERRRIARNLHDVTGQTLAALKMAVAGLERKVERDSCTSSMLSEIDALAEQALQEIRTMSYLLHPPLLDEIGFNAAAEWYVEGFAKRSGINAKLDFATESERLPLAIETALFRVLQESLTNVHRYSGSSEVSIHFQRQAETVILEVADCGRGIPPDLLRRLSEGCADMGVGLAGMRERMHELNGNLEIHSNGCGTSLRASVPLLAKKSTAACLDSQLCISSGARIHQQVQHA